MSARQRAERVLDDFTVQGLDVSVLCSSLGVSWGYLCETCEVTVVGWAGGVDIASAAVEHIRWHGIGKPRCLHCDSSLSVAGATECPAGECPERDGGAR